MLQNFWLFNWKFCVRRLPSRNINKCKDMTFSNSIIITPECLLLTDINSDALLFCSFYFIQSFSKSILFLTQNISKKSGIFFRKVLLLPYKTSMKLLNELEFWGTFALYIWNTVTLYVTLNFILLIIRLLLFKLLLLIITIICYC